MWDSYIISCQQIEETFTKGADTALVEVQGSVVILPYKYKQKPKKWYNKNGDEENVTGGGNVVKS